LNKQVLRQTLKKVRAALSHERREEAGLNLFSQLIDYITSFDRILSFDSFGDEISTSLLNLYLARTGRLLLPKIAESDLKIYHVTNPEKELIPNAFGLFEPDPTLCCEEEKRSIQLILVPALAFDQINHRLGYGEGFYDRFLKQTPQANTIGIGFKEQLITNLPSDSWDVPLKKVCLF
jgi:5-formyltetrahydrofolate cyclo-ligase